MNSLREAQLSFIGGGVMAESLIAGLLQRQLITPERVV